MVRQYLMQEFIQRYNALYNVASRQLTQAIVDLRDTDRRLTTLEKTRQHFPLEQGNFGEVRQGIIGISFTTIDKT